MFVTLEDDTIPTFFRKKTNRIQFDMYKPNYYGRAYVVMYHDLPTTSQVDEQSIVQIVSFYVK